MTQELGAKENMDKNYLKKDHKGVLVNKSMIKERDGFIYFLIANFAIFLILTGWFPFFENHRETLKLELMIGGVLILLAVMVGWYFRSRKCIGTFEGSFADFINALKAVGVYLNHFPKKDKCYEIQAEPITLSRKELVLVKDCGDFCEVTAKQDYIKYLAGYLIDLKIKSIRKGIK